MDENKKATKTIWMSRDIRGSDTGEVYFWDKKPEDTYKDGVFQGSDHSEIQHFDADCEAFQNFADVCGVTLPNHGEVVKLTVRSVYVVKKVSKEKIIKQLRTIKKYDAELMKLAANMLSDD